jgi:hypothetical protein
MPAPDEMKFFHERALPDLGDNKCGNSLIGPDFYDGLFVGAGLAPAQNSRTTARVAPS